MVEKQRFLLAGLASLLLLGACERSGDQVWEWVEYEGSLYGDDDRTAGKQFKRVLVSMASRKGAVLETMTEEAEEVIVRADTMPPMLDERPIIPRAVKISKYIPLDYDEIQFATAIPRDDMLAHSDGSIRKPESKTALMSLEDMDQDIELNEIEAEIEAVEQENASVEPAPKDHKVKDADTLFRGLAVAK